MIALDLSLENLYRAYYRCRRNKRNTANALRFEAEQEKHLLDLREALLDGSYRPSRSVCFFTTRPKLREILAADFRDRVVHHLLVDHLEQIWEPVFIHDSYACRRGKGVHRAVARLQRFIGQASANGTRRAWYLQLDVRNYFMSIDRHLLFAMLAARLDDAVALRLTRTLVFHDVTAHCEVRGARALIERIPAHKTLFGAGPGKGLPIGNLNSQFFANVYLDRLDQFVKHELKCRHYLRYCDDFVLLARERDELVAWQARIEAYLDQALRLELNPRRRLAPLANGVDFLGYVVRRDYRLVRRRVVHHLKAKLRAFESRLVVERAGVRSYQFEREALDALTATLSSYLGHLKPAQCWNLWRSLWHRFAFLGQYFTFDAERWKLVRSYRAPAGLRSVKRQYRHWRWRFPDDVLFFQVGRFMECYDAATPQWVRALGLAPMRPNRRGARCGFPVRHAGCHLRALLAQQRCVTVIGERRDGAPGVLERAPAWRHVPAAAP